jgi:muramoyltetrapeptide carboxypeptidase
MRKPKALRPGDTLRFVSPASPVPKEKTEKMAKLLRDEGYKVQYAPRAFDVVGYLAGSDADRARDFQEAFDDPEVDAIICTRGGYGCSRILPLLDLDRIAESGKQLIGYSDVTIIQMALSRRQMASVYAPMGITLHDDREPWVYESLLRAIKGGNPIPPTAPKGNCLVPGSATGLTTGGCMVLLCDTIGTPETINLRDRIVFLEDVDENPHRVDAMLTHLLNSGHLARAAGIVIGEMTRTDERMDKTIGSMAWRDIVRDRVAPLGIPTIIDFPFGHMKNMLTLPLGLKVHMDAESGSLEYLETL